MPHVIVKLYPGPSERQKARLAERIVEDVVSTLKCGEESVSVAIQEVRSEEWLGEVYGPEISGDRKNLYDEPGYGPLDSERR